MRKLLLIIIAVHGTSALNAQIPVIPTRASEDTQHIMAAGYWETWSDEEQDRIDADIDKYRKADAVFHIGSIKSGTRVKVEQISSEFIFGASAFNWGQLGDEKRNEKYRNLFGGLFNRATIPLYWSTLEPVPGCPRYDPRYVDSETWWNKATNKTVQPHWRRPATDPIVDWCNEHNVDVHGHPLVWGNRKTWPQWLQFDGIPMSERQALDTLEQQVYHSLAQHEPSYKQLSTEYIASLVPTYIKLIEEKYLKHVEDVMAHYAGRIQSWDVVNESARDYELKDLDPEAPMCRSHYGILFPDYVYKSFKKANECNTPGAILNINDFALNDSYFEEIGYLLERGIKIDVAGSQMHIFNPKQITDIANGIHLNPSTKLVEPQPIREYFARFSKYGIDKTCISEITIASAKGQNGEMIQAIIARNLYRAWFSVPSMMGITWWNLVDAGGAAGEPGRPGIFDGNMNPKPVYYALDNLINHEWRTNLELKPSNGNIQWRGFKGKYKISWTDKKGNTHTELYELK